MRPKVDPSEITNNNFFIRYFSFGLLSKSYAGNGRNRYLTLAAVNEGGYRYKTN
jgi:hypothetical protein